MWRYIVQRLLWLIVIIVCVAILIFSVLFFVPGDPAVTALGAESSDQERFEWRETYGLNDSYLEQLGRYLYDTFIRFDLGDSYITHQAVAKEFVSRLPRTLGLGLLCLVVNVGLGIPLGIACALNHNKFVDHFLTVLAMIGVCMPAFWLALLMQQLFAVNLQLLPAIGCDTWQAWIMPVVAGSISGVAGNVRQTRSAVLETIRADFITTARAKGVPEQKVIYKHMLPNALIPILSMLGGAFGHVISGTVIIETVFAFPGVGMYMLTGTSNRDYPVVRSTVLILAIFAAVVVLLVDLAYGMVDPRIKAQFITYAQKKPAKAKKEAA